MTVTLVRAADVLPKIPERDWSGELELRTVGRLEQEKNPFLLIDILAELERREPGRYRLTWIGRGPLESEFAERTATAGLDSQVELAGYVPFGAELLDRYRRAHTFVHVSLTEGVPQVLIEASPAGCRSLRPTSAVSPEPSREARPACSCRPPTGMRLLTQ